MMYAAIALASLCGMFLGLLGKMAIDWFMRRRHRYPLRERLKRWWRSGRAEPPASIEWRTREGTRRGRPVRATGLHLLVECQDGRRESLLVTASDAVNREEFWSAWKYFGGNAVQYVDDDGDPWEAG